MFARCKTNNIEHEKNAKTGNVGNADNKKTTADSVAGSSSSTSSASSSSSSKDPSSSQQQQQQQDQHEHQHQNTEQQHLCRDHYLHNNIPHPPSPPEPSRSFHKRTLPSSLIQFSSPRGKQLFQSSLLNGTAHAFFPLSEQFLSQSDPAYCGIATLIMIFNAMGIDPNIVWKGPWRWYGNEEMILDKCSINKERVKRAGILMEEFCGLARCHGVRVELKRPCAPSCKFEGNRGNQCFTIEEFRKDVIFCTQNPPGIRHEHDGSQDEQEAAGATANASFSTSDNSDADTNTNAATKTEGAFLVVAYNRKALGQTGSGHFSPVAAYSEETDKCLILDVARFKYPPYWVSVQDLFEALKNEDKVTNKSRGWFKMYAQEEGVSACAAGAS